MSTENERVVRLKLRNYARIWNVYSGFGWLLQPNYETTADFGTSVLEILGWSSSNYETTPGFETYIVKMEGWSGQTTKLQGNLEHVY